MQCFRMWWKSQYLRGICGTFWQSRAELWGTECWNCSRCFFEFVIPCDALQALSSRHPRCRFSKPLSVPKNNLPNSLLRPWPLSSWFLANQTFSSWTWLTMAPKTKISWMTIGKTSTTVFGEFGDYGIKRFKSVGTACSRRHLILSSHIAFWCMQLSASSCCCRRGVCSSSRSS